jgi:hypothetical protein
MPEEEPHPVGFESTGEVRTPKRGELYLSSSHFPGRGKIVVSACDDFVGDWPEIIMRAIDPETEEANA